MKEFKFKIEKLKRNQLKQACKLVKDCFNEFIAPSFSLKGRKEFLFSVTPEKFIERLKSKKSEYYVAVRNNQLIGIIRTKKNYGISLLFIDKKFQKKGIAKRLFKKVESVFKKKGNKSIRIKSSLYAIRFYEKMGFKKSTGITKSHGMIYQPMRKLLN